MRKYFNVFVFAAALVILASCAPSINEKLIVGKWTRDKILSFEKNKNFQVAPAATEPPPAGHDLISSQANDENGLIAFKQAMINSGEEGRKSIETTIKTSMEFRDDKSATVALRHSTLNGTWKMNHKGTKITVRDSKTKEKQKIDLISIDSLNMRVADSYPIGKMLLEYMKR